MSFQTRGTLKTESGVRFAYSIRVTEEDEEVESVVAWNKDGSVSHYALSEEAQQSELFPYVNEIIFCDHGDRGHIQTLMNLHSFFVFLFERVHARQPPRISRLLERNARPHGLTKLRHFLARRI